MDASSSEVTYHAYILRAWQERPPSDDRPGVWRYSLEDTRTRRRQGFASLDDLTAYLRAHAGSALIAPETPGGPER